MSTLLSMRFDYLELVDLGKSFMYFLMNLLALLKISMVNYAII